MNISEYIISHKTFDNRHSGIPILKCEHSGMHYEKKIVKRNLQNVKTEKDALKVRPQTNGSCPFGEKEVHC